MGDLLSKTFTFCFSLRSAPLPHTPVKCGTAIFPYTIGERSEFNENNTTEPTALLRSDGTHDITHALAFTLAITGILSRRKRWHIVISGAIYPKNARRTTLRPHPVNTSDANSTIAHVWLPPFSYTQTTGFCHTDPFKTLQNKSVQLLYAPQYFSFLFLF